MLFLGGESFRDTLFEKENNITIPRVFAAEEKNISLNVYKTVLILANWGIK